MFNPSNEIISVITKVLKCRNVDTTIKYHMYEIVKLDTKLNDKHSESLNPISEVLFNYKTGARITEKSGTWL